VKFVDGESQRQSRNSSVQIGSIWISPSDWSSSRGNGDRGVRTIESFWIART
jgi:hypothetical protein